MKKIFLLFFCFFILTGIGEIFSSEEGVSRIEYVCRDLSGEKRWQGDTEIRNIRDGVYSLVEKGGGIYSSFNGKISWVAEMEFEETEETVRPLSMEKRVFDADGKIIRLEKQDFNLDDNIVTAIHKDFSRNISRSKKFKFDKDIVNRLLLGPYIQKFIKTGKTGKKVQMVSEEPGFYLIDISIVDKEEIEAGSQKKQAYKLCIDPQLGYFDFVKVGLPKAYIWHSAEPKFEWLKYAGLEGDIISKKVEVTVRD